MSISVECEHGQLARQCPFCEYDAELRELGWRVKNMEDALVNILIIAETNEVFMKIRESKAINEIARKALKFGGRSQKNI